MNTFDAFLQLVMQCSQIVCMRNFGWNRHATVVGYLIKNEDLIHGMIMNSDLPLEELVNDYIQFSYFGGPKPYFMT